MSKLNRKELDLIQQGLASKIVSLWSSGDDASKFESLAEKIDFMRSELLLNEINKR
jgi:hypothetical protein